MDAENRAKELARSQGFQDPVLWEHNGRWRVVESYDTTCPVSYLLATAPVVVVEDNGPDDRPQMYLHWPHRIMKTVRVRASNIIWDTDGEEVELPTSVEFDAEPDELEDDGYAADRLSEDYGWCIESLEVEIIDNQTMDATKYCVLHGGLNTIVGRTNYPSGLTLAEAKAVALAHLDFVVARGDYEDGRFDQVLTELRSELESLKTGDIDNSRVYSPSVDWLS
jgi:hypothetical protein